MPLCRARIDQLAAQQIQRGHVVKLDIMKRIREDLRQPHQSGLHILQKKQVHGPEQHSAEAYRDGGRDDLAQTEEREAALIEEYLPEQLSDDELHRIVGDVVAETGAASPKEMGKVMSMVMPRVQGRADGKRVSAVVKEKLTA